MADQERFGDDQASRKEGRDLESLAIDPASGTVWGGYEFRKSIIRFHENFRGSGFWTQVLGFPQLWRSCGETVEKLWKQAL